MSGPRLMSSCDNGLTSAQDGFSHIKPSRRRNSHAETAGHKPDQKIQTNATSNTKTEHIIPGHTQNQTRQLAGQGVSGASRIETSRQLLSHRPGRPVFTALQQHHSPDKAHGHASKTQNLRLLDNADGSGSTLDPQTELAYLHLLHQPSEKSLKQWGQSAQRSHEVRFDALVIRHQDLKRQQTAQREQNNEEALSDWIRRLTKLEASKQLKSMATNIDLICDFLQPDSMYLRPIFLFDSWFTCVEEIQTFRGKDKIGATQNTNFIEDLGDGWHNEMAQLERKLNICACDLYKFGEAKPGSDLTRIIALCKSAIEGMLDEVRLTRNMAQWIMAQEREWISDGIEDLI